MSNAKPTQAQAGDSVTSPAKQTKDAPMKREQISERMQKRSDARRRLEDLQLERQTADLW